MMIPIFLSYIFIVEFISVSLNPDSSNIFFIINDDNDDDDNGNDAVVVDYRFNLYVSHICSLISNIKISFLILL